MNQETQNTITTESVKVCKPRKVVEPISNSMFHAFNSFLLNHNMVAGPNGRKRIRIYRSYSNGMRIRRSRDFVYVVSADMIRADYASVKEAILELSKKVMIDDLIANEEYLNRMEVLEQDLIADYSVEMNWGCAKSATFWNVNHVVTDSNVLKHVDNYLAQNMNKQRYNILMDDSSYELTKFRMKAKIAEMQKAFDFQDDYDWKYARYILRDGKCIAAYSTKGKTKALRQRWAKTGLVDKFGYNVEVISNKTAQQVSEMLNR